MTSEEGRSPRRRGRPVQFRAETAEAEELARWLYKLTERLPIRELAERFEYNKTKWAQFRNGSQLIPSWLLEKVVRELVPEPALQQRMLSKARQLLERAERAAAGAPTAALLRLSERELQARLEEARRGQDQAKKTLVGMTQLTVLLLGFVASLIARCQELEEQDAAARQQRRYRDRLAHAEAQLDEARQGREEAEELRLEAHLQAERYRRALDGPHLPITVSGSVGDLQPLPLSEEECDRLLEANTQHLQQASRALDDLRTLLGLPPRNDGEARIVCGQLADEPENEGKDAGQADTPDLGIGAVAARRFGYRVSPVKAAAVSRALYKLLLQRARTERTKRRFRWGAVIVFAIAAVTATVAMHTDMAPGLPWAAVQGTGMGGGFLLLFAALLKDFPSEPERVRRVLRRHPWQVWPCVVYLVGDERSGPNGLHIPRITLLDPDGHPVITLGADHGYKGDGECFPPGPLTLWVAGKLDAECVVAPPFPERPREVRLCHQPQPRDLGWFPDLRAHQVNRMVRHARTLPEIWSTPRYLTNAGHPSDGSHSQVPPSAAVERRTRRNGPLPEQDQIESYGDR